VLLSLTEPQENFVFSQAKYPAMIGGLGSGKTKAGTARLVLLMLQDKGTNAAYYMPTYDLLRLRAITGLEEELENLGLPYETNRADYAIKVSNYGTIILRSYDNPQRIVAYEVAHSIVDELDTLPKDKASLVWRKITERNRQRCLHPQGNTVGCVTTPDQGYNGFIYSRWYKNSNKFHEVIKAPSTSNPFIPDGYVEQIKENYDSVLAKLYLEGEIVSLTANKVYHFFNRNDHHSDRVLYEDDNEIQVGIDFNIGGCCAIVTVEENGNPITVAEFVSHDTRDFCQRLEKYKKNNRKIIVYPDASGKAQRTNASLSDIDIIRQAGYVVDTPRHNPPVRDRINAVNGLLSHNRWLINTETCPNLTESLEAQGYDVSGQPEKFSEHPAIDDWVDAAGYFIHRKWSLGRLAFHTDIGFAS
tara:strand:- start:1048 stop:2295 length:1248 start_codon:yes stop_codon:yes gene_type:complete